jgi:hypothetical protein
MVLVDPVRGDRNRLTPVPFINKTLYNNLPFEKGINLISRANFAVAVQARIRAGPDWHQ